jgi:hypothetical protein
MSLISLVLSQTVVATLPMFPPDYLAIKKTISETSLIVPVSPSTNPFLGPFDVPNSAQVLHPPAAYDTHHYAAAASLHCTSLTLSCTNCVLAHSIRAGPRIPRTEPHAAACHVARAYRCDCVWLQSPPAVLRAAESRPASGGCHEVVMSRFGFAPSLSYSERR